ncbi:MAG: sugar-binding protein [Caldilineaceae bacterium]
MANGDDFEILPEESTPPGRDSRPWLWVLVVLAIAVFAFAVGMAFSTFRSRVGNGNSDTPTPVVVAGDAIPTFTATSPATATATALGAEANATLTNAATAAAPTVAATATQPAPTLPATATPMASCAYQPAAEFVAITNAAPFGCATSEAGLVWSAWEPFERGDMLWRSDNDRAYSFFNDGTWMPINEKWDNQPLPTRGDPPPGLQAPIRGFGYAWGARDELFQRLGWATDQERGFCAFLQNFEHGFILQSSDVEFCQDNLFNQARAPEWKPLLLVVHDSGQWLNLLALPGATPPAPGPVATTATENATATTAAIPILTPTLTATPVVTARRDRPADHGIYTAPAVGERTLDANFGDWPDAWQPIGTVVQGANNYSGSQDLAGDFQVAWSRDGLYLAVRVTDDRYRSGPEGTDMWQGDSLEIHFDRALAADFDATVADADDYQIGVGFGPNLDQLLFYRWLPLDKEGALAAAGAVAATPDGYRVELLLPWSTFDVTAGELSGGQSFGFNLSISDNDADFPAQETVLSASPKRTTYNNPTEWATLVLAQ